MNIAPERLRTLQSFRDIVIIVGIAVLAFTGIQGVVSRIQARQEQAVRFAVTQNAIAQIEARYREQVAGVKDLNTIVLRQNELLIDYQKLLLQTMYLPASAVRVQPGAGGQAAAPKSPQPKKP